MDWHAWLILSCFLAGYCMGETIRLIQEIRAYRRATSPPRVVRSFTKGIPRVPAHAGPKPEKRASGLASAFSGIWCPAMGRVARQLP